MTALVKYENKIFALKEKRTSELGNGGNIQNEMDLLEQTNHENIITIVNSFYEKGTLYLLLEYADGGDLYQFIKSHRLETKNTKLDFSIVSYMSKALCEGLLHLHQLGIVHRDIKVFSQPKNTKL